LSEQNQAKSLILLVPMEGLEPTQYYYRGILNPLRLPFRHIGLGACPTALSWRRQSGFVTSFANLTERLPRAQAD
jgi:hypothetical protein